MDLIMRQTSAAPPYAEPDTNQWNHWFTEYVAACANQDAQAVQVAVVFAPDDATDDDVLRYVEACGMDIYRYYGGPGREYGEAATATHLSDGRWLVERRSGLDI